MPPSPIAPKYLALTCGLLAAGFARAAAVDDDFSDGVVGPQWSVLVDQPTALSLSESGGRLNLVSAGGGNANNDALYLSTFRLSTGADFSVRVDYALAGYTGAGSGGDNLGLVLGVGRDLDGTDSAAIGVGYGNRFGVIGAAATVAYRVDDVQTTAGTEVLGAFLPPNPSVPLTGTLRIDYTAATASTTDKLTLSREGSTLSVTFDGLVRGTWGATDGLFVSVGGRGSGLSATGGQLTLDHFVVDPGTVVPEPATLAGLAVSGLLMRRRSRRV